MSGQAYLCAGSGCYACSFQNFPLTGSNFSFSRSCPLRHVPSNPLKQGFVCVYIQSPLVPFSLRSPPTPFCTRTDSHSIIVIAFVTIIISLLNQQARHSSGHTPFRPDRLSRTGLTLAALSRDLYETDLIHQPFALSFIALLIRLLVSFAALISPLYLLPIPPI